MKRKLNTVKQDAIDYRADQVEAEAKIGGFGALACDDPKVPFYLVEFKSDPHMLKEETMVHGGFLMEEGTVVVDGVFYSAVPRQNGWHAPPKDRDDDEVFLVQHFTTGNVEAVLPSEENPPPKLKKNQNLDGLVFIDSTELDRLKAESHVRNAFDLAEIDEVDSSDEEDSDAVETSEEATGNGEDMEVDEEEGEESGSEDSEEEE